MSDHERQLTTCGWEEQTAAITVPNILYPSPSPTAAGFPKNRRVYIYQRLTIGPQESGVRNVREHRPQSSGARLYM